jgi:transposase
VALVDALGNLVRFVLLPGHRHDSVGVMPLIADIDFDALIADKAFDNNAIRAELDERGARLQLSHHRLVESRRFPTTQRCTSGGI